MTLYTHCAASMDGPTGGPNGQEGGGLGFTCKMSLTETKTNCKRRKQNNAGKKHKEMPNDL